MTDRLTRLDAQHAHFDTFAGVYPAMTTPFDGSGAVDHDQLARDARRLAAAGVDGLVPVGSTGESATVTHDEHVAVVKTVADSVDLPVIAGAGSNATHEAVSLSRRSVAAGADAVLLISPYYNCPEPAGVIDHYTSIADAVEVPCIVYNVPGRTGSNLAPETVAELAEHPRIAGYKAASGDIAQISEVIERTREETFDVLSGDDSVTLPVLSLGGTGTISVIGNVEPERTRELVASGLAGEFERAREIHHELAPLARALFAETNPIPVKAAMAIRGYGPSEPRSPLTEATAETRELLETRLAALSAETGVDGDSSGGEPESDDSEEVIDA